MSTVVEVFSDKDRVVIAFMYRIRDFQLEPDDAEHLSTLMNTAADFCEAWVTSGGKSEVLCGGERGALVKSWDGFVNVRLDSVTDRESIPYKAARLLAAEIRAKAPEARERMSISWVPVWRPNFIGA